MSIKILNRSILLLAVSFFSCGIQAAEGQSAQQDVTYDNGSDPVAVSRDEMASVSTPVSSSITGFYGGLDVAVSNLKNTLDRNTKETKKNSSELGFGGDIFCGYKAQVGKFVFAIEGSFGMENAKPTTEVSRGQSITEKTSVKRKYNFGLVPKIGYVFFNGFNAYLNIGTVYGNFNIKQEITNSKEPTSKSAGKTSFLVGLGAEQSFGSLFLRAECNKIFKGGSVTTLNDTKISADSYTFKVGGGYRF